ncbi:MAG TPA: HNH endonuclease [Candidatus Krumholzibacteria bacterium]|nr:HNH endonuclease [Candidatus Krumholzibacteria bacterium]
MDHALFDRECAQQVPHYTPPLSPVWGDRLLTQFLADEELIALFEEVKRLLPGKSSFADVMRVVFTEYRDRHSPFRRHGRRIAKSGPERPDSRRRECTRHIPDEVRDAVFVRDGGQCTFTAAGGTRCRSKTDLQIDHVKPFASGGTHDAANLRLLCAAHNRRAAELAFGRKQEHYRRE